MFPYFRRIHDDPYPFDGLGGVLAHTFPPEEHDAMIHIDLDENWNYFQDQNNSKYIFYLFFTLS